MHNEPMPAFPERIESSDPLPRHYHFSAPNFEALERFDDGPIRRAFESYLHAEALRLEVWLRRQAKPFFAEGYRIDELHILESRSGVFPSSVLRVLAPIRRLGRLRLALRRLWRVVRPYRIPEGKAAAHVAKV